MQTLNHQFINNQWVASKGTRLLDVMNPYREERIAQVTAGDAADVDAAVKAAQQAQPEWQALVGPNVPTTSMDLLMH